MNEKNGKDREPIAKALGTEPASENDLSPQDAVRIVRALRKIDDPAIREAIIVIAERLHKRCGTAEDD